jgi:site-specific recombinase XerD
MNSLVKQFQIYLKKKSLCALTIRGYVFDVEQFIEWSEENGILLRCVTPGNATQYLNYLNASRHEVRPGVIGSYSPNTIMKKIAAVRSFFDFLQADDE